MKDFKKKIGELELIEDLQVIAGIDQAKKASSSAKICNSLYKLSKTTFIEDLDPLMEFLKGKILGIILDTASMLSRINKSRKLQTATVSTSSSSGTSSTPSDSTTNGNNIGTVTNQPQSATLVDLMVPVGEVFTGDITVMASTDNLFAQQQNGLESHTLRPMNLTHRFP